MSNFLDVLKENYEAIKASTDKDIWECFIENNYSGEVGAIRNAVKETYEDLIAIYEKNYSEQQSAIQELCGVLDDLLKHAVKHGDGFLNDLAVQRAEQALQKHKQVI